MLGPVDLRWRYPAEGVNARAWRGCRAVGWPRRSRMGGPGAVQRTTMPKSVGRDGGSLLGGGLPCRALHRADEGGATAVLHPGTSPSSTFGSSPEDGHGPFCPPVSVRALPRPGVPVFPLRPGSAVLQPGVLAADSSRATTRSWPTLSAQSRRSIQTCRAYGKLARTATLAATRQREGRCR